MDDCRVGIGAGGPEGELDDTARIGLEMERVKILRRELPRFDGVEERLGA